MPTSLLQAACRLKLDIWRLLHPAPVHPLSLEDQFPWCSPNVWQRVVDFYLARPSPVIFEYGTGASSLHHMRNLLAGGGTYIGVEHEMDWYAQVLHFVVCFGIRNGLTVKTTLAPVNMPARSKVAAYDATLHLSGPGLAGCTAKLKLRSPYNSAKEGDGTLEEFREYVYALDEPGDVVVIDGRARKACVNYILDTGFLKPGGLLALFDAGRGTEGWLGWPALTGTSNYQPEVRRMLALGGEVIHGVGLDRWEGLKQRRTLSRNAYSYPSEACFLRLPPVNRVLTCQDSPGNVRHERAG
ncbi:MAG: hypothetical protein AB1649_32000 [Chloroflexota bacterium]